VEDALDIGDKKRNGKGEIKVYEATGATLDRFTMHIKASVWREENKRRAERMRMAKIGTLKQNRWPGNYNRFGYKSKREDGKRGRTIELGNPAEVQTVKDIFNWYLPFD
jgi:DNA invertase Pin-like site-specific DNA recombinase